MAGRKRREVPDVEGAPIERGVGPAREDPQVLLVGTVLQPGEHDPAAMPAPEWIDPETLPVNLSPQEKEILGQVDAAVRKMRTAFWETGKGLANVRDRHLYRTTYPNFEAFVAARYELSRPQAYRLMDGWELGEKLSPMGDINERQVRELAPLSKQHGIDAAVLVYKTISEASTTQVTGALIRQVLEAVPFEDFDVHKVSEQIRSYLAGDLLPAPTAGKDDPQVDAIVAAGTRTMRSWLQRTLKPLPADDARTAEVARRLAAELRTMADDLEHNP